MKSCLLFRVLAPHGTISAWNGPDMQPVSSTTPVVGFTMSQEIAATLEYAGKTYHDPRRRRHEIGLKELKPGTLYTYTLPPGGRQGRSRMAPDMLGNAVFLILWGESWMESDVLMKVAHRLSGNAITRSGFGSVAAT